MSSSADPSDSRVGACTLPLPNVREPIRTARPRSCNAAATISAALQDRGRAVLLGTRTFGKGSVQAPTQLSDGSALELTVGHYLTPGGRSLDGIGVEPDVLVPPRSPASVFQERAIEVLSGLTADAGSSGRG